MNKNCGCFHNCRDTIIVTSYGPCTVHVLATPENRERSSLLSEFYGCSYPSNNLTSLGK